MAYETKESMLERGVALMAKFCDANDLPRPTIERPGPSDRWPYGVCAYYRNHVITINVAKCASIGTAGMLWSFPGHQIDRTPYGVIQHELGHHADWLLSTRKGRYFGDYSVDMRKQVQEDPLTGYCPDDAEWFAEMFRLFVTNPDLLQKLRPGTYKAMTQRFKPVFNDIWRDRLHDAPDRTIAAIWRKLEQKPKARRAPKPAADQSSLL